MNRAIITLLLLIVAMAATAQTVTITGTVSDAMDHEPLPGATIRESGNKMNAVVTDLDGKYSITVKQGASISVSYIGYADQVKKVAGATTIDFALEPDTQALGEVVVIGYGTVKKSDLTGSVTSVTADKLQKTPSSSLANALQGQAAGVTVNSLSGKPGAGAEVRIRGVGTVNNSNPIYVVDGIITEDISFLSPNDIKSTEILKDASATAIYGSRGANGVVIVTTRSGSESKDARISFNGYVGVQSRWKKLDVMHAKEYADALVGIYGTKSSQKFYNEQGFNQWLKVFGGVGASPYYPTVYDPVNNPLGFDYSSQDTDWQDEVFRNAVIQNYHLSIDGSSDRFNYSISGSWFDQQGIIKGTNYSRATARLNTAYKATNWLKIGENISFMYSIDKNKGSENDVNVGILTNTLTMAPWDPVRYPEGSVNRDGKDLSGQLSAGSQFKNVYNPFSVVEYTHPKNSTSRWIGNIFAELTFMKGLQFRSTFNFDYSIYSHRLFKDKYELSSYDKSDKNFLESSMAKTFNWTVDNILTYTNTFGKHDLTAMVGQTVEQYSYYSIGNSGSTILNPVENNWYLSQVTADFGRPGDSVSRSRRFSWLGRVNYSFDNRYLATVSFRADGSSKFPEHAWGYFPSFSLAWRMSQESFLRDVTFLNDLKLRFGWGKVGNDKIGNDAFVLNMFNNGPTFVDYVFGQNQALANGAAVLTWINKGGRWESTEQWSVGIDFSMFNSRLTGSIEGFIRNTNDMLMNVTAPAQVGNRLSATANVGKVRNRGIEITLEHRNQVTRDFGYTVGGNISFIDNKLTALNGGSPRYYGFSNVQVVNQGFPLYYYRGLQYDGIFQTDEEVLQYYPGYTPETVPFHAGDARYVDADGDGLFDPDKDRVNLGSSIPKVNYGINLGATYKDFDLQIFFQGVAGNKIYNQLRMRLEGMDAKTVFSPIMADAWTPDNPNGSIPNPKNSVNYFASDRFLESGAYFRLKNIQLGYSLPERALKWLHLNNCRLYVQASNLFTITKYKGYDPEVSGIDYGNYPQSRTFIFGVNITY